MFQIQDFIYINEVFNEIGDFFHNEYTLYYFLNIYNLDVDYFTFVVVIWYLDIILNVLYFLVIDIYLYIFVSYVSVFVYLPFYIDLIVTFVFVHVFHLVIDIYHYIYMYHTVLNDYLDQVFI